MRSWTWVLAVIFGLAGAVGAARGAEPPTGDAVTPPPVGPPPASMVPNPYIDAQDGVNNIIKSSLGSIDDRYRGMHPWFNDDPIGNLPRNLGALVGRAGARGDLVGQVTYQPPGIPVQVGVDSQGNLSLGVTSSVQTPIGTFSVSATGQTPLRDGSPAAAGDGVRGGALVPDVPQPLLRQNGGQWAPMGRGTVSQPEPPTPTEAQLRAEEELLKRLLPPVANDGGFAPIVPQPEPPTPVEVQFRAADELFKRSGNLQSGPLWLGYAYYTKAVAGYRLAHHWLDMGIVNPDVYTGYRDAQEELAKAHQALEAAQAEAAQRDQAQAVRNCAEMLGYVRNLAERVHSETAQLNRKNPRPSSKPWRATYGGR